MATTLLGTDATNSLVSLAYTRDLAAADVASIALMIKNDQNVSAPVVPGAFVRSGMLFIPNRGVLQLLPGDVVAVDSDTGWPILVSSNAVANGPWTIT